MYCTYPISFKKDFFHQGESAPKIQIMDSHLSLPVASLCSSGLYVARYPMHVQITQVVFYFLNIVFQHFGSSFPNVNIFAYESILTLKLGNLTFPQYCLFHLKSKKLTVSSISKAKISPTVSCFT